MAKTDRINQHILQELSRDGRISNLELAERVGLSPSACLRRVQELERTGVITGYRATLSPRKLGLTHVSFVEVRLDDTRPAALEAFNAAVRRVPELRRPGRRCRRPRHR